jgi:hypothetical protein
MTQKQKYVDSARYLIDHEGYARNMLLTTFNTPSERTRVEDELMTMVYHDLLTYPILPSVREYGEQSLENWYGSSGKDSTPFFDFVYNSFSGRRTPLGQGVEILRDWPLDMIEWTVDNSQREDITIDRTPGVEQGNLTKPVPRSEMGLCNWDSEATQLVIGRNGEREDRPNDFAHQRIEVRLRLRRKSAAASLLRSPVWPDPKADKGHQHFSYALYPHDGDWRSALTVRHGYEYNYQLNARQVQSHTGVLPPAHSFVSVEPENLILTAMKKAEDSDALILRFYESAGRATSGTIHVPPGAASATVTNLMEHPEGQALPIKGSEEINVPASPYSIVSVQVQYPHPSPR